MDDQRIGVSLLVAAEMFLFSKASKPTSGPYNFLYKVYHVIFAVGKEAGA
jgi:hypothetical protein